MENSTKIEVVCDEYVSHAIEKFCKTRLTNRAGMPLLLTRFAELVIGPATSGRTRWQSDPRDQGRPQALSPRSGERKRNLVLAMRLRIRAIPRHCFEPSPPT